MPVFRYKEDVYDRCVAEGNITNQDAVDFEKINANLNIADEDLASAKDSLSKKRWNSTYKIYYDVLHVLVESYVSFDKIKVLNHQCLFAYLCEKHPELDFDWDFFEKIRTKRNGINYYGTPVKNDDWKEVEIQINLYINKLKEEIKKKIKINH